MSPPRPQSRYGTYRLKHVHMPEAAQKHVSKLIKVLYKLTLQSIYGTKIVP
nr:MAG TPA: hypothetical protein [Bacteriophage sp.]